MSQDTNGVSQVFNAAGQLDRANSANSESRSSSNVLVAESEAAGAKPVRPHGPVLSADADPAKSRIDKQQTRPDGLQSSSGSLDSGHANHGQAPSQPGSGPVRAASSAAHGSAPGDGQSRPASKLHMSDHAAAYLNQWNSGRAALSSRSRSGTADAPPTQLRSPLSALHLYPNTGAQDTLVAGAKEGEAAEVSILALSSPTSVAKGPTGVHAVMINPDVEIIEKEEARRYKTSAVNNNPGTIGTAKGAEKARARAPEPIPGLHSDGRAEKHQRGEKDGDSIRSKEQRVSGDLDVVAARGRSGKENHPVQVDDDDGSDIVMTSWNPLNGNKATEKHQVTKTGAKRPESSRTLKKGVAQVKKPERKERKGQKAKTTTGHVR